MVVLPVVLLLCAVGAGASPVRTYDQRQQGELNIHAQLDNIVIVLVPTSSFDLFGLKGMNRFSQKPNKDELLQFLQKPQKNDIDRYEIVKDENYNDIKNDLTTVTQVVDIVQQDNKNSDKEEEVVATVEEMKPDATEKTTNPPRSEATEDSPIKEYSTVSETVKDLVLKVSVPDELKNKGEPNKDAKLPTLPKESEVKTDKPLASDNTNSKTDLEKQSEPSKETLNSKSDKQEESSIMKETHIDNKASTTQKKTEATSETPVKKITLEDLIKPVAEKAECQSSSSPKTPEEPVTTKKTLSLVEGTRKEKVIRYKPDTKWAPGLVDMLGAPRAKSSAKDLEERQRFAALCAPGTWDTELKTCIMPGETRSRHELARFLEAMRFGIAIPSSKQ